MFRSQQRAFTPWPPAMLALLTMAILLVGAVVTASAAASLTGEDLAGKAVNPLRANPGEVVVLVFVRTDCPVSNRYAPTIQRLDHQYAGKVTFWLIYPDKDETPAEIQKYMHDFGYKVSALRDPQHELVKLGQVQITPEVAVFDSASQLVYHGRIDNWYEDFGHARSAPTTHELEDAIQAALSGKKPAVASTNAVGCYISDLE